MRLSDRPILYSLLFAELAVGSVLAISKDPFHREIVKLQTDYPAVSAYHEALSARDTFVASLQEEGFVRKYDTVADDKLNAELEVDRVKLKNLNNNLSDILSNHPGIDVVNDRLNLAYSRAGVWDVFSGGVGVASLALLCGTLLDARNKRLASKLGIEMVEGK